MGNGGVGVFLVSFIMREHERTLLEAGTVMGFIGLMGLLGTIVGGYLADRFTGARGRSYPLVCAIGAFGSIRQRSALAAAAGALPASAAKRSPCSPA